MKIKNDFVTNSSSSSFIIVINNDFINNKFEEDFFNISKKIFLDLILDCGGKELKTDDDILQLINKIYKYNDLQSLVDEESLKEYQKYENYLNNNFKMYIIEEVYNISLFHEMLDKMQNSKSKNFIIKELEEL